MKMYLYLLVAVAMIFAVVGCKKKTTSEKFGDALKSAEKDAAAAVEDAEKAVEDAKK
ncbi:MAG: hypothetical protein GX902_01660 [Lentisphaerae bacterium]|nr:hypothetical protein [Lentisphaerota bacterium]